MNRTLKVICRAIVLHQGQVLLVKKAGMDFWHFPGGKWEFANENLEQAAVRELLEETGYAVKLAEIVFHQELREPDKSYLELFWTAHLESDKPAPVTTDEEIQQCQWFKLADLLNQTINFKPNNSQIIAVLDKLK